MRFLAGAASAIVVLCSVITVHAAPTDNVTVAFTNQTVMEMPLDSRASPTCTRKLKQFPILRFEYRIQIPKLPEIHEIHNVCNQLWRELETWPICGLAKPFECYEGYERALHWNFHTTTFCNKGMVEAMFWKGTNENEFGGLQRCVEI